MKFSKLEQEQIKKLCEWAKEANRFMPIRDFYACSGLEEGTGVICIYDENTRQPKSILYVENEKCEEDDYDKIREYENNCLFRFSFIYKLEKLGLVTISKVSFPNEDSKGWACFEGFKNASAIDTIDNEFGKYNFIVSNEFGFSIIEINQFWQISKIGTGEDCGYTIRELSSKLDIFGLVTSVVSIEQELFELVSNGFKTYEDIQLEEAQNQTKIAHESLEEARKQTESANKSLEEARKQTKASLDSLAETIKQTQKTQESLEEAQKQSYQARTQTGLSILTLFLSVGAILWSIYASNEIPITINQSQFDSIQIQQKVFIETLNEIKMSQMDKDSVIKELDSTKAKIDKISNTLKEIKELNSKGK